MHSEPPIAYAHSKTGEPRERWESLREHVDKVAQLAEEFASQLDAREWGRVAGLWHDVGKYSTPFQDYLSVSAAAREDEHRADVAGKVDHSTAGAQHASSLGSLGRLLAYVIAGHHTGLPDDVAGARGLAERLNKRVEPYDAAPADLLAQPLPLAPKLEPVDGRSRRAFSIAFFTRMVFSCLVDADFLATESFLRPDVAAARPRGSVTLAAVEEQLNSHLERLQTKADDTPVNHKRRAVLATCRSRAGLPPGLFSLHVPTGGGKTRRCAPFLGQR